MNKKKSVLEIIAINLKKIRKEKNLSIEELSNKTGIGKCYIEKIEKGTAMRLNLSKIEKLQEVLKIEIIDFFN